jgi:hypothetical protein
MCVACGLPTTHSGFISALGYLSVFSFVTTTLLTAWWILTTARIKNWCKGKKKQVQIDQKAQF